MQEREFWRHEKSGEVYAVGWKDGDMVAVRGPLHYSEVTEEYLRLMTSPDPVDIPWMKKHEDEFLLHENRYGEDDDQDDEDEDDR